MRSTTRFPRWASSFVVLATSLACSSAPAVPDGAHAVVISVVDGDTFDAAFDVDGHRIEERIRLIGVDTPETKKPDSPVECFGIEAANRLAELLPPGTPIVVERDIESRDVYGRLLAHVRRHADGVSVNLTMLEEGLAVALVIEPNVAHSDIYDAAEHTARDFRRGLWSACGGGQTPLAGSVNP